MNKSTKRVRMVSVFAAVLGGIGVAEGTVVPAPKSVIPGESYSNEYCAELSRECKKALSGCKREGNSKSCSDCADACKILKEALDSRACHLGSHNPRDHWIDLLPDLQSTIRYCKNRSPKRPYKYTPVIPAPGIDYNQ